MINRAVRCLLVSLGSFLAVALAAQEPVREAIPNWAAPPFWSPSEGLRAERGIAVERRTAEAMPPLQVQADLTGPLPFVAVTPCRQFDSRVPPAPLLDNTPRVVMLVGAPCGIPATAAAVSANITVFNIVGAPSNGVLKVGIVSPPPTAWINFPQTETQRANAGILATDGSGNIVVQVNMGAGQLDFTVDVNGYYAGSVVTSLTPGTGLSGSATTGGCDPGDRQRRGRHSAALGQRLQ